MPIRRLVILAGPAIVVASLILLAGPTATAAAHTCGSNWCSGTDGGQNGVSSKNIQGSGPQIYNGEVGVYYLDVAGGSGGKPCPTDGFATGACFTASAASAAKSRWNGGTGMGVWFYYFGGGGTSSYVGEYSTPYCFGWAQGYFATEYAFAHATAYRGSAWVMTIDIEGTTSYGWKTNPTRNRQTFDGFTDYVAGRSSATSKCTYRHSPSTRWQYAVYTSPYQWTHSFGTGSDSQIAGTLKYTDQICSYNSWPGSFVDAQWFATSNYRDTWQYWHTDVAGCNYAPTDYDVLYEPDHLPVFGNTIGS